MGKKPKKRKLLMIAPDGTSTTALLPYAVSWAAARGIAKDTHTTVYLHGEYGMAEFDIRGAGKVHWNKDSDLPGQCTNFDERTTVAI